MNVHASVNEAFHRSLGDLWTHGSVTQSSSDPDSPGSNFGSKVRFTKQLVPYMFSINDPRERLVNMNERKPNPIFAVANALWILSGRNDLEFISYYNPRGKDFSDDGETLYGAYGGRLFRGCRIDQVKSGILEHLRRDPNSRRAFATIVQPRDTTVRSRDVPCLLSVQFLTVGKRLDMIASMRSQSAAMVMPYDLFALMFFHEAMCAMLGVEIGMYHHFSGSFHYYLEEEELVRNIIRTSPPNNDAEVPTMPRENVSKFLERTLSCEMLIRKGGCTFGDVKDFVLPEYWKGLIYLLGLQTWGMNEETLAPIPLYYRNNLIV